MDNVGLDEGLEWGVDCDQYSLSIMSRIRTRCRYQRVKPDKSVALTLDLTLGL